MEISLAFAVSVVGLVLSGQEARAQQVRHLYDFGTSSSPSLNGAGPDSTLIEVTPGIFYGTAASGGVNNCGVLFSITSTGIYTKLYDFPRGSGCSPVGALVQGIDGALYGVTGGNVNLPQATLFRSDLKGNVNMLAEFPYEIGSQSVTPAANGSMYLDFFTETACGAGENCISGQEIKHYTTDGKLITIVRSDSPSGTSLTTTSGGLTLGAWLIENQASTAILLFEVSSDDFNPVNTLQSVPADYLVGLTEGADGRLYFVTDLAVFSTAIDGSDYRLLQTFGGTDPTVNCETPETALTLASDGALYGGCFGKYPEASGVIYRISDTGVYSELYVRPEESDSSYLSFSSASGLAVESMNGTLFGEVAYVEGSSGVAANGFIYALELNLPKPKPVIQNFAPFGGASGSSVLLLGDYFLGTTQVTFNGVPAKFTIESATYLKATVPVGATTGPISVTNMNGSTTTTQSFAKE